MLKKDYLKNFSYFFFIPTLIIIITFISYKDSIKGPFVFDDEPNIVKFINIKNIKFKDIFLKQKRWLISFLNILYFRYFQYNTLYYKLGNIIIHTLSAIIIFTLLNVVLKKSKYDFFKDNYYKISLLTFLLFILHPTQTQTVSYIIQGQLEGLTNIFILFIISFFTIYFYSKIKIIGYSALILTFLFNFLICGTKEIGFIAPFLNIIFDWFFLSQGDIKKFKSNIKYHIIIFIINISSYIYILKPNFIKDIISFNYLPYNNIGNIVTQSEYERISALSFLMSQFYTIIHYIYIYINPNNIAIDYYFKIPNSFIDIYVIIPLIVLIFITYSIVYFFNKDKSNLFLFGPLWFFTSIIPRASIIPSAELIADYKTYIGSFGIIFFLSSIIIKLYLYIFNYISKQTNIDEHIKKRLPYIFFAIFAAVIFTITFSKNKIWAKEEDIWKNAFDISPEKERIANNLGAAYLKIKNIKKAKYFIKKALNIFPRYIDALNNMAVIYFYEKKIDKAIEFSKKALAINCLSEAGKFSINIYPHSNKFLYQLGITYIKLNKKDKALEYIKKAHFIDENNIIFLRAYFTLSLELNKYNDIIYSANKITQLKDNNDIILLNNIADFYFKNSLYKEACNIYKKIFETNGNLIAKTRYKICTQKIKNS